MSRHYIGVLIILVFFSSSFVLGYAGDGTAQSPYLIATTEDLMVLGGDIDNYDKFFRQVADIDLSEGSFDNAVIAADSTEFTGSYDGGGHSIIGLKLSGRPHDHVGLFGDVGSTGRISSLRLLSAEVTGSNYVGGIAGTCAGTISDSLVDVVISGDTNVGAIVGKGQECIISCCKSIGSVSAISYCGGIVGRGNDITVSNSYSYVHLDNVSDYYGGIVGYANGIDLEKCYYNGSFNGSMANISVCGFAQGAFIIDCFVNDDQTDLYQQSTFTNWDFSNETVNGTESIWLMPTGSMPRLYFEGDLLIDDLQPIEITGFTTDIERVFSKAIKVHLRDNSASGGFDVSIDSCSWGSLDSSGSDIEPGETVTINFNADFTSLAKGGYQCEISITSDSDGIVYVIPVDLAVVQPVCMEDFAGLAKYWLTGDCYGGTDCIEFDHSISGTIDIDDLALLAASWLGAEVKSEFFDDFESGQLNSHFWGNYVYPAFSVIDASGGNHLLESNSFVNTLLLNVDTTGMSKLSFDLQIFSQGDMTFQLSVNGTTWNWTETQSMQRETVELALNGTDDIIMFLFQKPLYGSSSYVRIDNIHLE